MSCKNTEIKEKGELHETVGILLGIE